MEVKERLEELKCQSSGSGVLNAMGLITMRVYIVKALIGCRSGGRR